LLQRNMPFHNRVKRGFQPFQGTEMKKYSIATQFGKAALLFSLVLGANAANLHSAADPFSARALPVSTDSTGDQHGPNTLYIVLVGLGVMGSIAARRRIR
jgi:hypothetical protein